MRESIKYILTAWNDEPALTRLKLIEQIKKSGTWIVVWKINCKRLEQADQLKEGVYVRV